MYYIKEYHTTTNIYVNMIYFLALIQSVFICSSFMLRYIDYGYFFTVLEENTRKVWGRWPM